MDKIRIRKIHLAIGGDCKSAVVSIRDLSTRRSLNNLQRSKMLNFTPFVVYNSYMKQYVQITAGRGPVECARVVYKVFEKLNKTFDNIELVDFEEHNEYPECFMSMIFVKDFSDKELQELKENWEGTIQYISTNNPYRPNHKRKNWFVGINIIDPADLLKINENEIIYDTCRSGGKGGQNVNKVETSVRATYKNISVKCSEERSQKLNKERAKERLLLKLTEINNNIEDNKTKEKWSKHTELERGNPKQIFRGKL